MTQAKKTRTNAVDNQESSSDMEEDITTKWQQDPDTKAQNSQESEESDQEQVE